MSTRCHIQFKQADGSMYPCMIYKHSDGYPEPKGCGVMSWLPAIVKAFHKERGDDAEYAVAQVLRHAAIKDYLYYEKCLKEIKAKMKKDPTYTSWMKTNLALNFTGWGVCLQSDPHGDIEYLYTVDLKNGKVTYKAA